MGIKTENKIMEVQTKLTKTLCLLEVIRDSCILEGLSKQQIALENVIELQKETLELFD